MSEKRCYTVKELQEILGGSRPTVYSLLKKNEFRWVQLGGGKFQSQQSYRKKLIQSREAVRKFLIENPFHFIHVLLTDQTMIGI